MNLLWWEALELEEHFNRMSTLWAPVGDGSAWARIDYGQVAFVLWPIKSESTSPYRFTTFAFKYRAWPKSRVDDYILDLATKFTMFGARMEFERLLKDELHLDAKAAMVGAILAGYTFLQGPASTPFTYLLRNLGPDDRARGTSVKYPSEIDIHLETPDASAG